LDFQKWFLAVSLILNAKKGISARQLCRDLEINKNTAWFIGMRIRRAMSEKGQRELLGGIVEMDETYVGGKPRKGSGTENGSGIINKRGRGTKKTPVVGMIDRGGNVQAEVRLDRILNNKKMMAMAKSHINSESSTVITDQFGGYYHLNKKFDHKIIDHSFRYADGPVHTNNIESLWALLKRCIYGQYHAASKGHLHEYVNEFCYRHNNRLNDDVFNQTIERSLEVLQ
jgi:transposase-like protein